MLLPHPMPLLSPALGAAGFAWPRPFDGAFWLGWGLCPGISNVWLNAAGASQRNRIELTMPGNFFTGPPVVRGCGAKALASSVPPQWPAMALKSLIPRPFADAHSE